MLAATAVRGGVAALAAIDAAAGGVVSPATGTAGFADDHHQASPAPTIASATTSSHGDGPQRRPPSTGPVDGASRRGGAAMAQAARMAQGLGGLDVDTAHPMRSWPYWFQIGLLPPLNEV